MAKIGDKFIIEIESVYGKLNGNEFSEDEEYLRGNPRLYKIKGFNSLVFDEYGLNRLEKYETTHVAGPADGHDLPEFIYGMSSKDKQIHLGRVVWQ